MKVVWMACVMALALTQSAVAQSDTFDVATFAAPNGWKRTESPGMVAFQHSQVRNGRFSSCQIFVFASRTTDLSAVDNFESEWNTKIAQPLRAPARPHPQTDMRRDGWTAVSSFVDIPQNGLPYRTILYTATTSGRSVSLVVNYTVDGTYQAEIARFFESLQLRGPATPQRSAPVQSSVAPTPAPDGGRLADYVYTMPDAWTRQNAQNAIVLTSPVYQGGERCQLTMLPMRPATRGLPDDALNIFREVFKTEPLTGDIYPPTILIRGTSPQGWDYFIVKKPLGPSGGAQIGTILLVAKAGNNLAAVVGTSKTFMVSNCFGELVRDVWPSFFYSLQFTNTAAQDQAAMRERLAGVWITATASVALRYEFSADGRYADAAGVRRRTSTTAFFGNGSYSFDGNTLVMPDDDKRRTTAQFRIAQESKDFGARWSDTLCLLSPGGTGEGCYQRDR